MLKVIVYSSWVVVSVLLSGVLIPVIQTAAGKSIVGNFADGYESGKEHGKNDLRSGNEHNLNVLQTIAFLGVQDTR